MTQGLTEEQTADLLATTGGAGGFGPALARKYPAVAPLPPAPLLSQTPLAGMPPLSPPVASPEQLAQALGGGLAMNQTAGAVASRGGRGGAGPAPLDLSGLAPKVVGTTKAGFVPTSRQTTIDEGQALPQTENLLAEGEAATRESEEDAARVGADEQTKKMQFAKLAQEQYAADQGRRAQQRADMDAQMQVVLDAAREVKEGTIDPNRVWHDKSTGGKIATILSLAGGGFMEGVSGKPDQGYAMLKDQIDQDVSEQRAALEGKSKNFANQQGIYALMRQRGIDEDTAEAAAHLAAHQVLEQQLDAQGAGAMGKLALDKMKAANRADMAKARMAVEERTAARVQTRTSEAFAPSRAIMSGGGEDLRQKILARSQELRKESKGTLGADAATRQAVAEYQSAGILGGPRQEGAAFDTPKEDKLSQRDAESVRAHAAAIDNIDQMLKLRAKHGGGATKGLLFDPSSEDRAVAKGLAARAQEQLVAALGRTNQGLLDRTSVLIPDDPLAVRTEGLLGQDPIGAGLKSARKMLSDELARTKSNPAAASAVVASDSDE